MAAKRPNKKRASHRARRALAAAKAAVQKRMAEDRARFLEVFRRRRSVMHACRALGIETSTAYRWKQADETFAAEWDRIDKELDEDLEDSARHRATFGSFHGIYHDGELVGMERKHETPLTIFMLKARKKETYQFGLDAMGTPDADKAKAIRAMVAGMRNSIEEPDAAAGALDKAPPSS